MFACPLVVKVQYKIAICIHWGPTQLLSWLSPTWPACKVSIIDSWKQLLIVTWSEWPDCTGCFERYFHTNDMYSNYFNYWLFRKKKKAEEWFHYFLSFSSVFGEDERISLFGNDIHKVGSCLWILNWRRRTKHTFFFLGFHSGYPCYSLSFSQSL